MGSSAASLLPAAGPATPSYERLPALQPEVILGRAAGENFPVALRLLPAARREDLLALYGFARLVDQIGDAAPGDRLALLDAVEADLVAAFESRPRHPLLQRLAPVLRRHDLPRGPFLRLIEANRWDQRHTQVPSFDALLDYCRLSANPVGELVLRVFGQCEARRLERSDAVCSALQVLEHCQDVAEDLRAGRCYLPGEDLARLGVSPGELWQAPASDGVRALVALQVERAEALLDQGPALVADLRGFARIAVAAFVAGGRATAHALRRAGCDPLGAPVRPRRTRMLLEWLLLLLGRRRAA